MQIQQINVAKGLFPGYAAAAVEVKDHGVDAVHHTQDAIHATDLSTRLDASIRAFTSLDHAIDNVQKLPVNYVPNVKKYLDGYQAAKQAATILIATGVIPGAREKVGKQQLLAAIDYIGRGTTVQAADTSKYGGKYATGLIDSAIEDATAGVAMLRPGMPMIQELLMNLRQVRTRADSRMSVDTVQVNHVTDLLRDAVAQLDQRISFAESSFTGTALSSAATADVLAQTDALLAQANAAGKQLVQDAPRVTPIA